MILLNQCPYKEHNFTGDPFHISQVGVWGLFMGRVVVNGGGSV